MKVLVVDDEPSVRGALERALGLDHYEVRVAEDGNAALDHLVEHRVDAIVLDVAMPGVDGLDVCRRLRAAGDRTPVLMLTARDAVDDRVAGLDAGAGERIELSRTEFALLQLFLEHPRQVLTRSAIFERVWGYDFGATSNALGVYVGYLRRKTEAGGEPLQAAPVA